MDKFTESYQKILKESATKDTTLLIQQVLKEMNDINEYIHVKILGQKDNTEKMKMLNNILKPLKMVLKDAKKGK